MRGMRYHRASARVGRSLFRLLAAIVDGEGFVRRGLLVIGCYRGSWCACWGLWGPRRNLLQLRILGAELVVISLQIPDGVR